MSKDSTPPQGKCPFSDAVRAVQNAAAGNLDADGFPVPPPARPGAADQGGRLLPPAPHFGPKMSGGDDQDDDGARAADALRGSNRGGGSQVRYMELMSYNKPVAMRKITRAEVAEHNKPHDAWTIADGRVYDITAYMQFHPGGSKILEKHAMGKDCTAMFHKYHPWVNHQMLLKDVCLGSVQEEVVPIPEDEEEPQAS